MSNVVIRGSGGSKGGGGGGGVESPDSLRSNQIARYIDALGEGEIVGLVNGKRSIYLNDTPLENADGSQNFGGIELQWRWGAINQTAMDGFTDVETETSVGVEVKKALPITRTLANLACDTVRVTVGVNGLMENDDQGNIKAASVEYTIEVQSNGGGFQPAVTDTIEGKTGSRYRRAHRIKLAGSGPWDIRVTRVTADSTSQKLQNTLYFDSYTGIISSKVAYVHTAAVGIAINAQQLSSVPNRAYHVKGLLVQVPSNYDPIARTYTGLWNGAFKLAWTNNPAWVLYDILTSERYGVGQHIDPASVDKWGLYQAARYNDQMVPDGMGGTEPRFTCNLVLQERADAFRVAQDVAGIMRAAVYWGPAGISVVQDRPSDPVQLYTNANVIDGEFVYAGTSLKARHTAALVAWNDPADLFRQKLEYVQDDEGVRAWGVIQREVTALGCSSRGQATRLGRWVLDTERLEDETITFKTGYEGATLYPGAVVQVSDASRTMARFGGRVVSGTSTRVTLDASVTLKAGVAYKLILTQPDGKPQTRAITTAAGSVSAVNVSPAFDVAPVPDAVYSIVEGLLEPEQWRIVSVAEEDDGAISVAGVKHHPGKYDAIEQGFKLDPLPISNLKARPSAPENLTLLTASKMLDGDVSSITGTLSWTGAAQGYQVRWRFGAEAWQEASVADTSMDIPGLQVGAYQFQVVAVNALGLTSQAAVLTHAVTPQPVALPAVTGLGFEGGAYAGQDAKFKWSKVAGATSYEVRVMTGSTVRRTVNVGDALRFNYTASDMRVDGGPWRSVTVSVRALGKWGSASPWASTTVSNPQAAPLTAIKIEPGIKSGFFSATLPAEDDIAGLLVWVGTSASVTPTSDNLVYDGLPGLVTISALKDGTALVGNQTYYVRAAAYDTFGKDALNTSTAVSFVPLKNAPDLATINADMILPAVLDASKFAAGVEPVSIHKGASLPTVKTTEHLNWQNKLYRWDGTKYTAAVPAVDVTGQLASTQIADKAITAAKFAAGVEPVTVHVGAALPTTKTTETLTWNGKLYRWSGSAYVASVPAADVTGALVSSQISDAAITAAKFSTGIEPVTVHTGAALPTTKSTETLTWNGKLYRWSGSAYVASVPTADLTGTISGVQIADAAITTAKFAANLEPVTIHTGASLPTVKSTTALSWNGKLYRWDGSKYSVAVDTSELTGTITKTQIADNSISTGKLEANAVTTAKINAGAVTANGLAANSVVAGKIAANAITARELAIGDFYNYIQNGNFMSGADGWPASVTHLTNFGGEGLNGIRINAQDTFYLGADIPVVAGEQIALSMRAYVGAQQSTVALGLYYVNSAGALSGAAYSKCSTASKTPVNVSGVETVPAGKVAARICIQHSRGSASTHEAYVTNLSARRVSDGTLISDGAITTAKIAANAVTANEIAANTITSKEIAANTITSAQIAAGGINANSIDTRGLSIKDTSGNVILAAGTPLNSTAAGITNIQNPEGALISVNSTNQVGALKITLPQSWTSTMIRFRLEIFEYTGAKSVVYEISSYNYTNIWVNSNVQYIGDPAYSRTVRFGHDGTKCCIWIGETTTSWKSPKAMITSLMVGHSNNTVAQWGSGWAMSFDTAAAANVTQTVSNPVANGKLGGIDKITASNTTTYIDNAAIKSAQIDSLHANKIEAGTITGDKIKSNEITTAHMGAGTISTNVLRSGTGGNNLIPNAAMVPTHKEGSYAAADGWMPGSGNYLPIAGSWQGINYHAGYKPPQVNYFALHRPYTTSTAGAYSQGDEFPVEPGKWYEMSAYGRGVNTNLAYMQPIWRLSNGTVTGGPVFYFEQGSVGNTLGSYPRLFRTVQTPGTAVTCTIRFGLGAHEGAAHNMVFAMLPYFGLASGPDQSEPSPWSPSGFSTTIHGGAIKTNTITANEIASGTIIADNIASNAITTAKIQTNAVTSNEIASNAVTTAKIAAGAVTATEIAADSITASKLVIADTSTLVPDAEYNDPSCWSSISGGTFDFPAYSVNSGTVSNVCMRLYKSPSTGAWPGVYSKQFPLVTGKQYRLSTRVHVPAAAELIVRCHIFNGSTPVHATEQATRTFSAANWYDIDFNINASGGNNGRVYVFIRNTSAADHVAVAKILVRESVESELIVDGAITSAKLTTGSVIADKIAANAVTADKIAANAVTADKIAANSVTATQLSSASIETIHFNGKVVKAANIDVVNLSAVSAVLGNVHTGSIRGGQYENWAWPSSGSGFYLGPEGIRLGREASGNFFEVTAAGAIKAPGFSVAGGVLSITQANVIDTLNIKGQAITAAELLNDDVTTGGEVTKSTSQAITGGLLSIDYLTATLSVKKPSALMVICEADVTYPKYAGEAWSSQAHIDILVNGAAVSKEYAVNKGNSTDASIYTSGLTVAGIALIPAGTSTITLQVWKANSTVNTTCRSGVIKFMAVVR